MFVVCVLASWGTPTTRGNTVESTVIAGFVPGMSVRKVERTLADAGAAEAR
jgi:hypothetical protein